MGLGLGLVEYESEEENGNNGEAEGNEEIGMETKEGDDEDGGSSEDEKGSTNSNESYDGNTVVDASISGLCNVLWNYAKCGGHPKVVATATKCLLEYIPNRESYNKMKTFTGKQPYTRKNDYREGERSEKPIANPGVITFFNVLRKAQLLTLVEGYTLRVHGREEEGKEPTCEEATQQDKNNETSESTAFEALLALCKCLVANEVSGRFADVLKDNKKRRDIENADGRKGSNGTTEGVSQTKDADASSVSVTSQRYAGDEKIARTEKLLNAYKERARVIPQTLFQVR